jgi:hypothetical protein
MNKFLVFVFSLFFSVTSFAYVDFSQQVIEYQLDGNQFAVVVMLEGTSLEEARAVARKRAAEVAFERGSRYYVVDSEVQTEVIRSQRPNEQGFFGNMYQELIIEEQFHKDRLATEETANEGCQKAVRLVFSCYKEKPRGKDAIDICTTGQCS